MQFLKRTSPVLFLILSGACDIGSDRVLTPVPQMVTPKGTAFFGKDGLRAPGPINQLCLDFPKRFNMERGNTENAALVTRADGKRVELAAYLVSPDSQRTALPFRTVETDGDARSACFEQRVSRDSNRRYPRGELRSNDSIVVLQIRWSPGR